MEYNSGEPHMTSSVYDCCIPVMPSLNTEFCNRCGCVFDSISHLNEHISVVHSTTSSLYPSNYSSNQNYTFHPPRVEMLDLHNVFTNMAPQHIISQYNSHPSQAALQVTVDTNSSSTSANQNCIVDENKPLPSFASIRLHCNEFSNVQVIIENPQQIHVEGIQMRQEVQLTSKTRDETGSPIVSSSVQVKETIHKCYECNKTFSQACYLTQHNRTSHDGDKPFKCATCGKHFACEELFQVHKTRHTGDKPHKCEICPKQFNYKTDLKRHMFLHTGQKPFTCDICFKGFVRKDHMMRHRDTHIKKMQSKMASTSKNYPNETYM